MANRALNLADLFEIAADHCGDRTALVAGGRRLTYAELDERANRLAHHLAGQGVGHNDFVGLQLVNGTEYIEGMLAAYKIRAVPVNVNYRYVEGELEYLYEDAGLVALIVHDQFADRAAAAKTDALRHMVVVGEGGDYEDALAAASAARDFGERSADDLYVVYTGGTTGMPKGVLWRHEDIFFASLGGGDPFQMGDHIKTAEELAERIPDPGMVVLATPPLMHASAHWVAFSTMYGGGKVVLVEGGRFDPPTIWRLIGDEKVNTLVVVGDAMARPIVDAYEEHKDDYDPSSLIVIGSGGALLSPATKTKISKLLPHVMIVDGFGSSETGTMGRATGAEDARFTVGEDSAVFDDDMRPVTPGSGDIGQLARRGFIPLGYHNDPEKTKKTFAEIDGVRWVLPGDMATVEEDGTITLLGRGSVSINTGGEKVYPEEVEAALKSHDGVADAVVVGVKDERWGEKVTAVVQAKRDLSLEEVQEHCKRLIAGYKIPRGLKLVDEVVRSPSGKADYRWAKEVASEGD